MNNQQKNIGLLIGILLSIYVVYRYAIQKTIVAKNTYKSLLAEKELLNNATSKITYLQGKNADFDSILAKNNISIENSFQETLLEKITEFSARHPLEILRFDEPHQFLKNKTITETFVIELKGDFSSNLQLLNYLEQQQFGELASVSFQKKTNYTTQKKDVILTLFLKKNKNID